MLPTSGLPHLNQRLDVLRVPLARRFLQLARLAACLKDIGNTILLQTLVEVVPVEIYDARSRGYAHDVGARPAGVYMEGAGIPRNRPLGGIEWRAP